MTKKSAILHFGRDTVDKPILTGLIRGHDVDVNILQASITPEEDGTMFVQIEGTGENVQGAFDYLEGLGVRMIFPAKNIIWDDEKCTHCGACVGQCLPKALAVDGNLAFAKTGRRNAAVRLELGSAIQYHLDHPGRLVDDDVLAEAISLLERARTIDPRGPKLAGQIDRLDALVTSSSVPVPVSLHSDNETQVVIYKVGRLGVFSRKTLELRPGTYTVVGTRSGFRDVRLEITVRPDGPNPPVVIRCEDEV